MIFPVLEIEEILQVNDRTRISGLKTFSPDNESITLIEIEPEAAAGFIDVTTNQFVDYQYSTDGSKVITLRVTGATSGPQSITGTINVLTAADDKLFSGDAELVPHEPKILNWVRDGRNSFLDVHRLAQDRILTWLDEHKIWDVNGNRLTKDAIIDIAEVNDWSKYLTLQYIFEGLSNAIDDIFDRKAQKYSAMASKASHRAALRLDRDGDGNEDSNKIRIQTATLRRR